MSDPFNETAQRALAEIDPLTVRFFLPKLPVWDLKTNMLLRPGIEARKQLHHGRRLVAMQRPASSARAGVHCRALAYIIPTRGS